MDGTILGKKYDLMGSGGGGGGASSADKVSYDNTTSQLTADNVQEAIDEVVGELSDVSSDLGTLAGVVGDAEDGLVKDVADLGTDVSGLSSDVTELQNANKYLTSETLVGKWGNSNLYRKYVHIPALPSTVNVLVYYDTGLSNVRVRRIELCGYGGESDETFSTADSCINSCSYYADQNKIGISVSADVSDYEADVILEYTK